MTKKETVEVKVEETVEPIKKEKVKKVTEKKVETPLCKNCGERPRYELTNRKTGASYWWTYCSECETDRQKTNRAKKKVRNTPIDELELNIAPQTYRKKNICSPTLPRIY